LKHNLHISRTLAVVKHTDTVLTVTQRAAYVMVLFHRKDLSFMIHILLVLMAVAAASLGCGGAPNETNESELFVVADDTIAIDEATGLPLVDTDESRAENERMFAEMGITRVAPDYVPPGLIDDLDRVFAANQTPDMMSVTDKGSIPLLTGWALKGVLRFQDNVRDSAAATNDHCSLMPGGAEDGCDKEWHAQARDTYYDNFADGDDELTGLCGNAGLAGQGAADWSWLPCAFPRYTGAPNSVGRTKKWRLIETDCGNSTARGHLRGAIIQALSYYDTHVGFNFTETTGGDWNILFTCGTLPGLQGRWAPRGNLTPRNYLASFDPSDPSLIFRESCETPNLPGSRDFSNQYETAMDYLYTYDQGEIRIDIASNLRDMSCVTDSTRIRRGIAHVVKHELGHHWGLTHHEYSNPSLGLMRGQVYSCQDRADYSIGLVQNYVDSLLAGRHDHENGAAGLELPDNDLSCFRPRVD
jgi:hypothetical protein